MKSEHPSPEPLVWRASRWRVIDVASIVVGFVIVAVWLVLLWSAVTSMWDSAPAVAALCGVGGTALGLYYGTWGIRLATAHAELTIDGIAVSELWRHRFWTWDEVSGVEVYDPDFPILLKRTPCLRLHTTDRRSVRLLATAQSGWKSDERSDALRRMADQLRDCRRTGIAAQAV